MNMKKVWRLIVLCLIVPVSFVFAQVEDDEDEEDWDMYGEVEYSGGQSLMPMLK